MAKNIPQLFRSLKGKENDRAGLKQYLVNMVGEGQRIRLYCIYISITGRISRCRFEYAVWLAETTFFYGADNTAEQPLIVFLRHIMNSMWQPAVYSSTAKGAITGLLDTLGLVYTVQ